MRNEKGIADIVFIIIIVLLLIVIGWFIIRGNSAPRTSSEIDTTTTEEVNPAEGWRIGEVKLGGFQYQYPQDWYWHYSEIDTETFSNTLYNYDIEEIEKYMDHGFVDLNAYGKDLVKMEVYSFEYPYTPYPGEGEVNNQEEYIEQNQKRWGGKVITDSNFKIGGLETVEISSLGIGPSNPTTKYVSTLYASRNGRQYVINVYYDSTDDDHFPETELGNITKAILSTFEFN